MRKNFSPRFFLDLGLRLVKGLVLGLESGTLAETSGSFGGLLATFIGSELKAGNQTIFQF